MNRLTRRTTNGPLPVLARDRAFGPAYFVSEKDYTDYRDALEKLARYEDTGLEPEQCAKYAQAEKEGRLLVLPCKVGDELWIKRNGKIQCETVDRIAVDQTDEDEDLFISIYTMSVSVLSEDIGRLVFLTREDAEKALEVEE
ncbi:MAG: hypothetical protein VZQ75_00295 [Candidatus Faecousia sp.]|nr:hypothetical protein [Candidatus Faecousia sp.]